MSEETLEGDPLVTEVCEAWAAEWGCFTHTMPGDRAVLRFIASVAVHRLRRAGISDLVIARALIDDGLAKREVAPAE